MDARRLTTVRWVLVAVVVVGLAVDAIVHFDLASAFPHNKTSVLSEEDLFRAEGVVSILAALAVLLRPRRYTAAFAVLVGASAFAAAVVYRYVNVGKIGPVPNMYDPYWAPSGKVLSVIGEAAAALAAAALFLILHANSNRRVSSPRVSSMRPGAARAG
jgi:glucan phosphoethanolaminetransferase (alkaline phosphatase superfamily)